MFALRDYQQQVISDTYNFIRQQVKRILIFAPTGAGKTIIITRLICDAVSRGRKVLFVVHREILVNQTFNQFAAANLQCGFIKAGWQEDSSAPVQIASVQTLSKREDWKQLKFDVIVFDECHLVAFAAICQEMMAFMSLIFKKLLEDFRKEKTGLRNIFTWNLESLLINNRAKIAPINIFLFTTTSN